MSSREIAELTGKEHRNIRRDIENMAKELSLSFEQKVLDSTGGRPSVVYLLQRREVEVLLTGYCIPLRAKVIDRLHELEQAQQAPRVPRNLSEACPPSRRRSGGSAGSSASAERGHDVVVNPSRTVG